MKRNAPQISHLRLAGLERGSWEVTLKFQQIRAHAGDKNALCISAFSHTAGEDDGTVQPREGTF